MNPQKEISGFSEFFRAVEDEKRLQGDYFSVDAGWGKLLGLFGQSMEIGARFDTQSQKSVEDFRDKIFEIATAAYTLKDYLDTISSANTKRKSEIVVSKESWEHDP